MRIIGIDPGLAIVGYSILDIEKDENKAISLMNLRYLSSFWPDL